MRRILYILALALSIVACTEEIDKSNRYTFTGETVADYMLNRSDRYSHFINLLKRSKLLGLLNTYGRYTLFLPDNEAVEKYVQEQDSIYHATKESDDPVWTGVTSPLIEDLSDSMINVIARTHLVEGNYQTAAFDDGALPRW
ncbi:MAG: fasciclin domain-containing protein, partial [Bacteroidaceae bacterium]|nr:fasciclin domain-containing protein [Bacteroidaceae bacterium]